MSRPISVAERPGLLPWYNRNRERSAQLFGLIADEAYYSRPIALRNPIVFYQGHIPAFSFNTLVKQGLGRPSIDARLELLFARGIDPHEDSSNVRARGNEADLWPSRDEVQGFCDEADRQVRAALAEHDQIPLDARPLDYVEAAHCILEHEATHLETLMYMWHQLPLEQKRRPAGYRPLSGGQPPAQSWIEVPPGQAALGVEPGTEPFAWDNEMPAWAEQVPAFRIQQHNVSNADYLEFVEAGGYADARWWRAADWAWINAEGISHPLFWQRDGEQWLWRGMFDRIALPAAWPVWVSQAEASAYCRWRGLSLPSEAQYQRAAYGAPDGQPRRYPWGNAAPDASRGVFDFHAWDPQPIGSHPAGRSAWGVDDLVGNGWEWTATAFAPFPGFEVRACYPEYSAEFFDGEHFVMKGAAPVTVSELLRPSLRNWFRARYPYMYASFRCVAGAGQ
ncbi:SUMF1/EgtB/PvdO family nonheme iron enzyme [Pseudomonas taeanensis]|uniref:SUMF1/EgtB/PvdO family nonheme iron enzyme n=1 Tax=Pseudomonas taeanensis TaxID=574962 RepID=UPI000468ADAE|nr:SUMF1/EgtB/PvdO family nonheme iron enzyme [Pseudomonas taeanensis]